MGSVLVSFWAIVALMAVGYVLARIGAAREGSDKALSRMAFYGPLPALLFQTVSASDPRRLFSLASLAHILVALVIIVIFALVGHYVFKYRGADLTITTLTAAYTNVGNLGVVFLAAVVGDPSDAVPILLFQMTVLAPIAFAILDRQTAGIAGDGGVAGQPGEAGSAAAGQPAKKRRNWLMTLLWTFAKPPVAAVLLGILVAATGWDVPAFIEVPVEMLAGASVPIVLLSMGISWRRSRLPLATREHAGLYFSVLLRGVGGPLITWVICLLFGIHGEAMLTALIAGAFPAANNVYIYANEYGGVKADFARDAVLVGTLVSMVSMLAIVMLYHM